MSIRQRRAHRHSRTHIVGFGILGFFGFIALLAIAIAVSIGTVVNNWLSDLPDYQSADAYLVAEPTQVIAGDGTTVLAEYYLQNRRSVDLSEISDYVSEATVDVEDERFYQHNGVDPQGIVRAIFAQLSGRSEGASTITQQLVRNTVLSDEQFDNTLKRKVREAYIAIQMEKTYTKDQILNMYLNTIYYGHGAYGIEAAAITYFNKDAKDLTLNEAATLAGLPNSPSYYDPTVNMDACVERRNHVLDRMLSAGDITQEEYDETVAEPITLNLGSFGNDNSASPYFTDYVRQLLEDDFSSDVILKGGLKVYTTLDLDYQAAAEKAVSDRLDSIDEDNLQAALVAVDPSTGYIKAMVGGKDYNTNQYNMATQAQRQTGSSFKVFTLIAALESGVSPDVYINCNSPKQITSTWKVQNYGNESYGNLTLTQALAVSSNTGFAQIAVSIGADKIVEVAKDMGIDEELSAYPSITLGTEGVPPVQMAEAYATLATGGVHRDAIAITKIEDRNGNVVYEHQDNPTQAVDPAIAQAATTALETVVTSSSGTAHTMLSSITYDQPIAGKTGTSEDYRDLWFCGYTPQISVAIWVGNTDDTTVYVNGSYGHPYTTACPIFAEFTNSILDGIAREEFPTTDATPTYKDNSSWDFSVSVSSSSSSKKNSSTSSNESSSSESSSKGDEATNDSATTSDNATNTSNSNTSSTDTNGTSTPSTNTSTGETTEDDNSASSDTTSSGTSADSSGTTDSTSETDKEPTKP
ncbi:MAG: PBP1A family penicillin-binding protein [Atopobium sp.]|nr:PBP1A family penicillin-binding protein [Atopobium sp.]